MAYVIEARKKNPAELAGVLPITGVLKNGVEYILDQVSQEDLETCKELLNEAIKEGMSYPQEKQLDDQGFRAYFLSHDAFCLKVKKVDGCSCVLGTFYIKPKKETMTLLTRKY